MTTAAPSSDARQTVQPRKELHGFPLYGVTAILVATLERIESPFLKIVDIWRGFIPPLAEMAEMPNLEQREARREEITAQLNARISAEVSADPRQEMEFVFAFITPPGELCRLAAEERKAYRDAALAKLGTLHPRIVGELETECEQWYFEDICQFPQRSVELQINQPSNPQ